MSRLEESLAADLEKNVQLGKDNSICISQMRLWCKNVEIQRTAGGLYAEMTGLPIAAHSISCSKVPGQQESMNLRWISSEFLTQNCATCPFHSPNGDPSWGQEIIDSHKREIEERRRVSMERDERISKLRSELRSRTREITKQAQPESYRILEYLEDIFSEDDTKSKNAADRLEQSAILGADIIPDAGVELILLLAGSAEYSWLMLPVCMELRHYTRRLMF